MTCSRGARSRPFVVYDAPEEVHCMKAEAALERHQARLMSIPGVEGVGIGGSEDSPVIVVMVRKGGAAVRKTLPTQVEGYPVKVEVTGEITAR
jgi:hypothetical protein